MLRDGLAALVQALDRGDMAALDALARDGGQLDGAGTTWTYLPEFFQRLKNEGELDTYLEHARGLADRVIFTGQVDHAVLRRLWPLAEVSVVCSTHAEAFGMVSAEAAACGAPPLVSHHSGLADVADAIARDLPANLAPLISFDVSATDAIEQLAQRLIGVLSLNQSERKQLRSEVRNAVVREWGWDAIAERAAAPLLSARV
jgi:glycosyltransferase involved in cell wall biosynthesis